MAEKLWEIKELREIYPYSDRQIRRQLQSGKIKGFRRGGKWLIPDKEVRRLLGREEPPTQAPPESKALAPSPLMLRHWGRLRNPASKFHAELSIPSPASFLGSEVFQKIHTAAHSGSPLLVTWSWVRVVDAPFEAKRRSDKDKEGVEIRLLVEKEFLFPHLMAHLRAEFAEFEEFEIWKDELGKLVDECLQIAGRVSQNCRMAAGMYYLGGERQTGLTWDFPAFSLWFVVENPYTECVPQMEVVPQPDGLWKLVPKECPNMTLAVDSKEHIPRCHEVLVSQIRENIKLRIGRQINEMVGKLKGKGDLFQTMLTTVIERGDFKGTCSLCEGYTA